jgi:hypothetical protein
MTGNTYRKQKGEMEMIEAMKAFFTLFQQGKALASPGVWANNTALANIFVLMIGAVIAIGKGFGHDLPIDDDTQKLLATSVAGAVVAFNTILHLIAHKDAGVPPSGGDSPT